MVTLFDILFEVRPQIITPAQSLGARDPLGLLEVNTMGSLAVPWAIIFPPRSTINAVPNSPLIMDLFQW